MGKKKDLTGQTFGYLSVIKYIGNNKHNKALWLCKCLNCYNFKIALSSNLINKKTMSCGCYRREKLSKNRKDNLVGQKFGRLTVVKEVRKAGVKQLFWLCECSCGGETITTGSRLKSGATQSCGCLQKERASDAHFKDIGGQTFGRLTALEHVGVDNNNNNLWRCVCSCKDHNEKIVACGLLTSGGVKSCGCLVAETSSKNIKELHKKQKGENNPNWKGGNTSIYVSIRSLEKYKTWVKHIMERDDYTCQFCGDNKGGNLNVHHIKHFADIISDNNIQSIDDAHNCEEFWDINNGITLCEKCHKLEHYKMR